MAKARLYTTGLGMYARILRRPVSDVVLEPGQTTNSAEVDYRTYDLAGQLRRHQRAGVQTGSGAYQRVKTPAGTCFGGRLAVRGLRRAAGVSADGRPSGPTMPIQSSPAARSSAAVSVSCGIPSCPISAAPPRTPAAPPRPAWAAARRRRDPAAPGTEALHCHPHDSATRLSRALHRSSRPGCSRERRLRTRSDTLLFRGCPGSDRRLSSAIALLATS